MTSTPNFQRNSGLLLTLIGAALLMACSFEPELQKPAKALPESWALSNAHETAGLTKWWMNYGDTYLPTLVDQALSYNADLQLAYARVAQARAQLGGTIAQQYPSLNVEAGAMKGGIDSASTQGDSRGKTTYDAYYAAPVLSYEVDLWGRLANTAKAAREQLLAEEANARTVRLAIIAETVSDYFAISALNEQIATLQRLIKTRQDSFNLQQSRLKAGDIDELALRQAESELISVQSKLPNLEEMWQKRVNALAILCGSSPRDLADPSHFSALKNTALPMMPGLPKLTPAQAMANRPDIMRADHLLVASNANIGVAHAAYLPRLSLSALFGYQSLNLDDIMHIASPGWNAVGSLAGPLLDFGRARAQVEASEAQQKQAYITYEQTVRVAFREMMDALIGQQKTAEHLVAQNKQVKNLQRSVLLAKKRYAAGYSNYLDVLDAERTIDQAQIDRIEAARAHVQTSVDLYKSLGGDIDQPQQ